jgi:hypothetical protein
MLEATDLQLQLFQQSSNSNEKYSLNIIIAFCIYGFGVTVYSRKSVLTPTHSFYKKSNSEKLVLIENIIVNVDNKLVQCNRSAIETSYHGHASNICKYGVTSS